MRLTLPQQDIYFEQLLYPNRPIYNIGAKIAIKGTIHYEILNKAYIALIDQHDAYRSRISYVGDEVAMDISDSHDSILEYIDFSDHKAPDTVANEFMQQRYEQPFDLRSDALLHKFILIKVEHSFYYLFSMYHHIITDGWGTSLMFQRLVSNYNELLENGTVQTAYPYSYLNFGEDDQAYHTSESFLKDKRYWKEKFQTLPERFLEKINHNTCGTISKRQTIQVKRSIYNQLNDTAKACKASTFHVILGILYTYFGRKHQQRDLAIGVPVLNRGKSIFKKTVGLFMGVTGLRIALDFDTTFEELIHQIKQQLRHDYRHQRFPLGKLIQELRLFDEKDRLFNITLSYEKQDYADHFQDTHTTVIPMTHHAERVGLALYIREFDDQEDVRIDFDYNIGYFDDVSIQEVATHFETLLVAVTADSQKKLSEYTYLQDAEEKELLLYFNQTYFHYPKDQTLVHFFEKQAQNNPNDIAVRDVSGLYTYAEFDQKSNQVANYLIKNFLDDDKKPVGVLMHRSADLVVVLMGILKSGLSYIPLDPDFPKERLAYIVDHSEVTCIIGTSHTRSDMHSEAVFLEANTLLNYSDKHRPNLSNIQSSDTAYTIYTSGSTGNPKGVVIRHQSLLNFLISIQKKPGLTNQDLLFSVTTQSFDISVLEFFVPLLSGASLYVANKDILKDPLVLKEQLNIISPTIIQATPSFYQMLYNAGWKGNKQLKVLCGGDLLSQSLAKKLVDTCSEVWNMYGPTETTIWSSVKQIQEPKDGYNIGKPIHNTCFYILDEYLQLLPKGAIGTLYIGGDGLAAGYLKDEEKTTSKFIESPFQKGEKIYNTGDLGRWNHDGEIEFFGRNDHQVKIRGYRIELGEIETKLNQLQSIVSSVVVAKKTGDQEASLIAYVVADKENIDDQTIIREISKDLPEYMIPYTIVQVDGFPMTPNNKIDREALTKRDIRKKGSTDTKEKPETTLEICLCTYFGEVLELTSEIGVVDNFFSLGGHSLKAVKLISKISDGLQYQISLKDIFDHPTVRSLSVFLEKQQPKQSQKRIPAISKAEKKPLYPITMSQYALWLAGVQKERSIAYNMFSGYRIHGKLHKEVLAETFQKMIDTHEILRTNFTEIQGFPYQKITEADHSGFKIDEFYCDTDSIKDLLEDYANKEFDLEHDRLIRVGLFQDDHEQTRLLFVTHHIIMDGWSLEIFIKEFVSTYKTLSNGNKLVESAQSIQFKDYALWQEQEVHHHKDKNHTFWKQYLQGYSWSSLVPYDHDLNEQNYRGAFHDFEWNKTFLDKIQKVTTHSQTTLHNLLATAFSVLIHTIQGHEDICVGIINAGRPVSDLQEQIGMFAKTLPLRMQIHGEQSFLALLQETQQDLLTLNEHQDIPWEIQNTLRLEAIMVLQDTTLNYNKIQIQKGVTLESQHVKSIYSRLPLLMNLSLKEERLQGTIQYDISKYEHETVELLVLKFERILEQILSNPTISIHHIDTQLDIEKQQEVAINFSF